MRYLYIFINCLFLSFTQLNSQTGFSFINTDKGFPSNEIYSIMKDSKGDLWIGTNNGLVKWNGSRFHTYTIEDGLPSNSIWMTHEDSLNRIWLFNNNDMRYYFNNDSIYQFKKAEYSRFPSFTTYYHSSGYTAQRISIAQDISGDSVTYINYNESRNYKMGELELLSSYSDSEIYKLLNFSKPESKTLLEGIALSEYLIFYKDNFLVLINRKHPKSYIISDAKIDSINFTPPKNMSYYITNPLVHEDNIIVDFSTGQFIIDLSSLAYKVNFFDPNISFPVNRHFVLDSNFILMASRNEGLAIKNTRLDYSVCYDQSTVNALEKVDSTILVLNNQSEIYKLKNDSYNLIYSSLNPLKMEKMGDKINIYDKKKTFNFYRNKISSFKGDKWPEKFLMESGFMIDIHNSTLKTIKDKYLLASEYLFCLGNQKNNFKNSANRIRGLHDLVVYKGQAYVSSYNTLNILNDSCQLIPIKFDMSLFCRKLWNYENEYLILTNSNGMLAFYNGQKIIYKKQFDSAVEEFLYDDINLYFISNDDLLVFPKNTLASFKSFVLPMDNLLGMDQLTDMVQDENALYISGSSGVIRVEKKSIKPVITKPKILSLDVSNEGRKLVNKSKLNHDENRISFSIQARSFESLNKIKYHYTLKPLDQKFNSTTHNTVEYPSLSPGTYIFETYITDVFDNASNYHSFKFVICPVWYKDLKYVLAIFTLLGLLLYLWYRKRLISIQAHSNKELKIEKRIAKIELEALRSQMNPHFIFNSLSAIQSFMLEEDMEQAEDYLTKLARLIRKFLDYSKTETISIKEEIDLLKLYVDLENRRMNNQINITWEVDESIDILQTLIPTLLLQPFIENSINHGLFHKKGEKELTIKIIDLESSILIEIEDNGIGRFNSESKDSPIIGKTKSHGTNIVQDRIMAWNRTNKSKITLDIKDKIHQNGKANGTIVFLNLKTN